MKIICISNEEHRAMQCRLLNGWWTTPRHSLQCKSTMHGTFPWHTYMNDGYTTWERCRSLPKSLHGIPHEEPVLARMELSQDWHHMCNVQWVSNRCWWLLFFSWPSLLQWSTSLVINQMKHTGFSMPWCSVDHLQVHPGESPEETDGQSSILLGS